MPRGGGLSDESLRALERAAAADPSRTLGWAKALARAGRADEAWVALCRAVDQPDARAELATRPAWTHAGGRGRTHALDLPPVKREPRVRWMARAPGDRLLASPLGVVVTTGRGTPCVVLDPTSGRLRWTPSSATRDAWLDRSWLLAHFAGEELHAWRLWNEPGEEHPVVGHERLPSGLVQLRVRAEDDGAPWGPGAVSVLHDVRPLRLPDGLQGRGRDVRGGGGRVVTGPGDWNAFVLAADGARGDVDLLVASGQPREGLWTTTVFEIDRGGERWRAPGRLVAGDARGVVLAVQDGQGDRLMLRDAGGGEMWSAVGELRALGADVALVELLQTSEEGLDTWDDDDHASHASFTSHLRVLDRATGRLRADLGPYAPARASAGRASPILVRDRVFVPDRGDVVCRGLDGQVPWSVDVAEVAGNPRARVVDLAPLPGALVVALDDRQVVCLEEPPVHGAERVQR